MEVQPADCFDVRNWVLGENAGYELPRVLRVRLDADSVEALEAAMQVRSFADRTYGDTLIRRMELAFPGAGVLEYLREEGAGKLRRWYGEYDEPRIKLTGDGIEFEVKLTGSELTFLSETVSYEVIAREIRNWRSMMFGETIEEAMPGGNEAAAGKSGNPSPL